MNLRRILFLVFLSLGPPLFGQLSSTGTITASGATCATTNACIAMTLFNTPTLSTTAATITVSGTYSGTLQFESSADGVTFAAITGLTNAGSSAFSTTSTGTWTFGIPAQNILRVRASAFASGTATVLIQASAGQSGVTSAQISALFGGPGTSAQYLAANGTLQTAGTGSGSVTSVGLNLNSTGTCGALAVTGSPVTVSGTLNINFTGVNGDVATFNGTGCLIDSGTLLSALATLASPTFTGTVTIPTAAITTISGNPNFSGTPTGLTAAEVGLGSVTNDAQTKAAIVPNTAPSAGQILAGNAGGTAYAPVSMSQDCTITSGGVITCLKTNNTSFSALATTTPGSGIATFLATPSSANLLSAMTTKTGTNNLVFSTAPTLDSTLTIGAVSGTSGTINLLGTTSGTYTVVTTATAVAAGFSGPIRFADNTGSLQFSQTTSTTGTAGLGLSAIGTGATEAWDFTGGTGTNLLKSGAPCALTATVTMNVSGTAVTFCTWTLPNAAKTWAWQCYGTYTTATATDTLSIGYTAAQAPTGVTGNAIIYSNLTGTSTAGSVTSTTSTANQTILTGASVSNVTNEPFMVSGVIQASATSGTFVLTGALTGTSPSGTINPGTTCNLY